MVQRLLLLVLLLQLAGPTLKLISSRLVTRPPRHVCMLLCFALPVVLGYNRWQDFELLLSILTSVD